MKRPSGKKTKGVTVFFDVELWERLKKLADSASVSKMFVIRRAIIDVVNRGEIPWPSKEEIKTKERDMLEVPSVTPVFDALPQPALKGRADGRKGRVGHVG